MGLCFIHFSSSVILGYYFKKYRNAALSMAMFGISIGNIVFPLLYESLIERYGTWGTLLISGAMQFHVAITGSLMRPMKRNFKIVRENGTVTKNGRRKSSLMYTALFRSLSTAPSSKHSVGKASNTGEAYSTGDKIDNHYKTINFKDYCKEAFFKIIPKDSVVPALVSTIALCLFGAFNSTITVHYLAYAEQQGVDEQLQAILLSVMGISGIACRIFLILVTSTCKFSVVIFYIFSGFSESTIGFIGPYFTSTYPGHVIFMSLFSFMSSMPNTLLVPVGMEVFGEDRVVEVTGLLTFMDGLGQLAGPPVAGR